MWLCRIQENTVNTSYFSFYSWRGNISVHKYIYIYICKCIMYKYKLLKHSDTHTHTNEHITHIFPESANHLEICHPHRSHKMEPFVQYPEKRQDQPPGIWWKRSHTWCIWPTKQSHFGKGGLIHGALKVACLHHVKPIEEILSWHITIITSCKSQNIWNTTLDIFHQNTSVVSSCERSSVPDSHPRKSSPRYNGMSKEKATNKSSKSCANGKGNGTSLPFQELAYHSRSWL